MGYRYGGVLPLILLVALNARAEKLLPRLQLDVDRRDAERMQLGYGMVSETKVTKEMPDLLLAIDVPLPSFIAIKNTKTFMRVAGQVTYSPATDHATVALEFYPLETLKDETSKDHLINSSTVAYVPLSMKWSKGDTEVVDAGVSVVGWQKRGVRKLKDFTASELDDFVRIAIEAVKVRYVGVSEQGGKNNYIVGTPAVVKVNTGLSFDSKNSANRIVFELGGVLSMSGAFSLNNRYRNGEFTGIGSSDFFAKVRTRIETAIGEWELGIQSGVLVHRRKTEKNRTNSLVFLLEGSGAGGGEGGGDGTSSQHEWDATGQGGSASLVPYTLMYLKWTY